MRSATMNITGRTNMPQIAFRSLRLSQLVLVLVLCVPAIAARSAGADPYDEAVHHAGRSAHDLARDAIDHPADLLRLTKIAPGMRVADVLAGDGYYSELASYVVGPTGHVLLLNNAAFENFSDNGW